MSNITTKTLKIKIGKILRKSEGVQITPKYIRSQLEKELNLAEGALEEKKDEIRQIIKQEVEKINEMSTEPPTKRKKERIGPKKARNAYSYFSAEFCSKLKRENPSLTIGDTGKLAGQKWKELTDEEKKPFVELAGKDKLRYEKEKEASGGNEEPAKKSKKTGEKTKSGYQLFCDDRRPEIKTSDPTCGFVDMTKKLAEEWSNLDSTTKDKYQKEASKAKGVIFEEKHKNDPPSKNRSSYIIFTMLKRDETKNENPELSVKDLMKKLSEKWKQLTPQEKDIYDKMADKEKEEYQERYKQWEKDHPDIVEAKKNETYALNLYIKHKKKENLDVNAIKKLWNEMNEKKKKKHITSALEYKKQMDSKKSQNNKKQTIEESGDEADEEGEEVEEEEEEEEETRPPPRRTNNSKAVKISKTDDLGSDGEFEFQ